jgi:hypothetical protein
MKKILVVTLSTLTIVGAIQFADRALTSKQHVIVADGSDPMPLCRKKKCSQFVSPTK